MADGVQGIPLSLEERYMTALRVARQLCACGATAFDHKGSNSGERTAFLRAVHVVTGQSTAVEREDVVPYSDVGDLLERCLRARIALADAATGRLAAPPPTSTTSSSSGVPGALACWLTLALADGCVAQHAFFGLAAAGGQEPLSFTTALTTKRAAIVPGDRVAGPAASGAHSPVFAASRATPTAGSASPLAESDATAAGVAGRRPTGGESASGSTMQEASYHRDGDYTARLQGQWGEPTPSENSRGATPRPAGMFAERGKGRPGPSGRGGGWEGSAGVLTLPPDAVVSAPAPLPPPPASVTTAAAAAVSTRRPTPVSSPATAPPQPADDIPWPPPPPPALRFIPAAVPTPSPSPARALPGGRPNRGGGTSQACLTSPSRSRQQDADWARRYFGSPFREELWRLGDAAMTTNHVRGDSAVGDGHRCRQSTSLVL